MADTVKARIAALLRKARDAGASEAEAMAAAARAAQLLREHGLTEIDVEYDEGIAPLKTRKPTVRASLWAKVARATNCAAQLNGGFAPGITFVGKVPGPQIAVYLVALLDRAVDRELDRFKQTPPYRRRRTVATRRQAANDFVSGLCTRLGYRLLDLFAETISEEAFEESLRVRDHRLPNGVAAKLPSRGVRFEEAASAGWRAGGSVPLSRGVGGEERPRQIGRA